MVDRQLIEKLDKATDNAVRLAVDRSIPLPLSKKISLVGDYIVEKQKNGYYKIDKTDRQEIYKNISSYDVCVILCQRLMSGETGIVKRILVLDDQYQKYRTEMIHYLSCMKGASRRHDYSRMAILEDKFRISEMMAKKIKNSISFFKKTK